MTRTTTVLGVMLGSAMSLGILSLAYSDDTSNGRMMPGQTNAAKPTSDAQVSDKSPKDVCNTLAEAAKKDDFQAFTQWTTGFGPRGGQAGEAGRDMPMRNPSKMNKRKNMQSQFHQMHKDQLARLKDLSCGSETIAMDHAFVEAESKGEKRLIPFKMMSGKWMFDAHTYMSFYRESMKDAKKSG
jgi:hypothetical protein